MQTAQALSGKNVYGITYATFDESELRFESEMAIHLADGSLLTLQMPTQPSERQAIQQLLCERRIACAG